MELPVIIEPIDVGFRAIGAGGLSVGLVADGQTAEEAISRLAERVRSRVEAGATMTELSLSDIEAPWKQDAGYLRDDPMYEAWREAMAQNRRRLDEDPDAL
ncbi:hypothetical protein [Aquisphaera insulae]|uniref:hypothetical protein n=1 Tax=Aquisphaera insulae TaxID=2712864 RepID=UPI0013EBED07|nr:hypothetical protein [Aquisphaera insulae]